MKKRLVLLLTVFLLINLSACSSGDTSSASSREPSSTALTSQPGSTTTYYTVEQETTQASKTQTSLTVTKTSVTSGKPTDSVPTVTKPSTIPSSTAPQTTTTSSTAPQTTTTSSNEPAYVTVHGSEKKLATWVYQLTDLNLLVREARFDSEKGGDPVTVIAMSDIHIPNPDGIINIDRGMQYASAFDQTVILGDTLDYFSASNAAQLKMSVWNNDPSALVVLGNHDSTLGASSQSVAPESRYAMLREVWKHDILYTSQIIRNKVMVIQLDNSQSHFWAEQVPKLKDDLDTARKNGYAVLLFYHIPLHPGNTAYRRVYSFNPNTSAYDFFAGGLRNQDEATQQVYELITNSADVIRGTFCGHLHNNYYLEITAKTPNGEEMSIPQYVLSSMMEKQGNVMKITVT